MAVSNETTTAQVGKERAHEETPEEAFALASARS